jgi:uncharacterized surface protein with fasciclin (FAS1) repeats
MTKRSFHAATAIATLLTLSACASAYTTKENQPMKNIVEIAVASGNFKTLVAAVQKAGLVETLEGPGPFTVFAPTDLAFAKLPAGTINALLMDKEKLASVLTYHVVAGRVVAADIIRMNGETPVTVNGQKLDVTVRAGKVYVNGAHVTTADVYASNGVIHVIDGVLMPKTQAAMAGR